MKPAPTTPIRAIVDISCLLVDGDGRPLVGIQATQPAGVIERLRSVVLRKNRELLCLDRALGMDPQPRLVAAVFPGGKVTDHVHPTQPVLTGYAASPPEISLPCLPVLGMVEIL